MLRDMRSNPLASFAAMATVRLPLKGDAGPERATALMRELAERHGIEAAVVSLRGGLWVRVGAQAYNELADYERLAALYGATR